MRYRCKTIVAVMVVGACLSGCGHIGTATVHKPVIVPLQERNFAGALEFLRKGHEQEAKDLLERVVASAPIKGITDEAMFRLALMYLRDESVKGVQRAILLLDQLKNDYPRSIWTHQSAPLVFYLTVTKSFHDKQRELKNLRELNQSLNHDNQELRQTLERLKNLDLELEKKNKR